MFKNVFSGKGRIRRTEYALSWCIVVLVSVIVHSAGIAPALGADDYTQASPSVAGWLVSILILLALLWFFTVQHIKHLHDVGRSGWFTLLAYVPIVCLALMLYLVFAKGTKGPNRYGEDPKGSENDDDLRPSDVGED